MDNIFNDPNHEYTLEEMLVYVTCQSSIHAFTACVEKGFPPQLVLLHVIKEVMKETPKLIERAKIVQRDFNDPVTRELVNILCAKGPRHAKN